MHRILKCWMRNTLLQVDDNSRARNLTRYLCFGSHSVMHEVWYQTSMGRGMMINICNYKKKKTTTTNTHKKTASILLFAIIHILNVS